MNSPWEFGWEAIGVTISLLTFVILIIVEWNTLSRSKALVGLTVGGAAFLWGMGIGAVIALTQDSSFWLEIVVWLLAMGSGGVIGIAAAYLGYRDREVVILLLAAIIGLFIVLRWVGGTQ